MSRRGGGWVGGNMGSFLRVPHGARMLRAWRSLDDQVQHFIALHEGFTDGLLGAVTRWHRAASKARRTPWPRHDPAQWCEECRRAESNPNYPPTASAYRSAAAVGRSTDERTTPAPVGTGNTPMGPLETLRKRGHDRTSGRGNFPSPAPGALSG